MPAWEGVGGVLPAGPGAAPAPQRQLQPGQGLHHETHHQLPAHEETAQHRSVSVGVVSVSGEFSFGLGSILFSSGLVVIKKKNYTAVFIVSQLENRF